jgi:hypothetical protein
VRSRRKVVAATAAGFAAIGAVAFSLTACSSSAGLSATEQAVTGAGCKVTENLDHQQTVAAAASDPTTDAYFTTATEGVCPNGDMIAAIGLSASGQAYGPLLQQYAAASMPAGVTATWQSPNFIVEGPAGSLSQLGSSD